LLPFVHLSVEQARDHWKLDAPGEARLMIGSAIRAMCRARKSRATCHFAAAIGLGNALEGKLPAIPDYALDVHTVRGRQKGRGLSHFLEEGAKLIPPQVGDDPWKEEAIRLWRIKYGLDKQ
jgi:hypothetical protein